MTRDAEPAVEPTEPTSARPDDYDRVLRDLAFHMDWLSILTACALLSELLNEMTIDSEDARDVMLPNPKLISRYDDLLSAMSRLLTMGVSCIATVITALKYGYGRVSYQFAKLIVSIPWITIAPFYVMGITIMFTQKRRYDVRTCVEKCVATCPTF
jgi:hypothetical protein